jgi:hypothetical protein
MPLRDTNARFRKRVRYWGVEAGVWPLAGSAAASGLLALYFSQNGSSWGLWPAVLPFALTFTYHAVFVTGRRPHFRRDLWGLCLRGGALSPAPRGAQPQHPSLKRLPRGIRHATKEKA